MRAHRGVGPLASAALLIAGIVGLVLWIQETRVTTNEDDATVQSAPSAPPPRASDLKEASSSAIGSDGIAPAVRQEALEARPQTQTLSEETPAPTVDAESRLVIIDRARRRPSDGRWYWLGHHATVDPKPFRGHQANSRHEGRLRRRRQSRSTDYGSPADHLHPAAQLGAIANAQRRFLRFPRLGRNADSTTLAIGLRPMRSSPSVICVICVICVTPFIGGICEICVSLLSRDASDKAADHRRYSTAGKRAGDVGGNGGIDVGQRPDVIAFHHRQRHAVAVSQSR